MGLAEFTTTIDVPELLTAMLCDLCTALLGLLPLCAHGLVACVTDLTLHRGLANKLIHCNVSSRCVCKGLASHTAEGTAAVVVAWGHAPEPGARIVRCSGG